jgi:hypothetical protein
VNATPTCPVAVVALVITGFDSVTVSVRVAEPVPPALVALIVTVEVAAVVGVPVIRPVDVLTFNPAGNPVALKLVGVLLAVIW